jgi:Papain-like cysteine protease AvrRpt2
MNRMLVPALLICTILASGGCTCKPVLVGSLPVPLHPQETSMWCWAASGQMVMHYLGNNVSQCTEANNRFGRTDCPCSQCTSPVANPPCVIGGWPEFDKYGFTFKKTTNAALSWDDLREQLSNEKYCKKKPFAFTWHWPGGGGHMMVAKGYLTISGTNYVVMLNPWAPCAGDEEIITYDYYVESPGHHTHWDDYYDVTRR